MDKSKSDVIGEIREIRARLKAEVGSTADLPKAIRDDHVVLAYHQAIHDAGEDYESYTFEQLSELLEVVEQGAQRIRESLANSDGEEARKQIAVPPTFAANSGQLYPLEIADLQSGNVNSIVVFLDERGQRILGMRQASKTPFDVFLIRMNCALVNKPLHTILIFTRNVGNSSETASVRRTTPGDLAREVKMLYTKEKGFKKLSEPVE